MHLYLVVMVSLIKMPEVMSPVKIFLLMGFVISDSEYR